MKYIDVVDKKNIVNGVKHPNKRIVGSELYFVKDKNKLNNLFKEFKSKKFLHLKQISCQFFRVGGILQEKINKLYTALIQTRTSSTRLKKESFI